MPNQAVQALSHGRVAFGTNWIWCSGQPKQAFMRFLRGTGKRPGEICGVPFRFTALFGGTLEHSPWISQVW